MTLHAQSDDPTISQWGQPQQAPSQRLPRQRPSVHGAPTRAAADSADDRAAGSSAAGSSAADRAAADRAADRASADRTAAEQTVLVEILLVEDSEADILLTREAFEDAHIGHRLHVARDGVEALSFLRREPPHQQAPRPDVLLLDINMPRMNGLELLEELKRDPDLRAIPVVVLTTSQADEDILRSYQSHASSYIVKPVGFENFFKAIQAFEQYWLHVVRLPRH